MTKFAIALALAVAPLMAGCETLQGAATGAPIAGATVFDEKALYAAEAAYNVPAHAYVTADANGLLTPALKARLKPLLFKAYDALHLARSAYMAGDARGFQAQAKAVAEFANQANALIPRY